MTWVKSGESPYMIDLETGSAIIAVVSEATCQIHLYNPGREAVPLASIYVRREDEDPAGAAVLRLKAIWDRIEESLKPVDLGVQDKHSLYCFSTPEIDDVGEQAARDWGELAEWLENTSTAEKG